VTKIDTKDMLREIDREIGRLEQVRQLLTGTKVRGDLKPKARRVGR
jgi:hypothetical protein